jgi:four helix bundle protein
LVWDQEVASSNLVTPIFLPFTFEKLHVDHSATTFADEACDLIRTFPRGYFFLADQLNRAALSIAANIAEGNGRFTKADHRTFSEAARGSVQEFVSMLRTPHSWRLAPTESPTPSSCPPDAFGRIDAAFATWLSCIQPVLKYDRCSMDAGFPVSRLDAPFETQEGDADGYPGNDQVQRAMLAAKARRK